jgi:hypothetical protein
MILLKVALNTKNQSIINRTIVSHHTWNTIKTTTYDVKNPGPGLEQTKNCGRFILVSGIPNLPSM